MANLYVPQGKSINEAPDYVIEAFTKDFLDPTLSVHDLAKKWNRATSTIYNWGNIELKLHRPKLKVDNRTPMRDLIASVARMACDIPEITISYTKVEKRDESCELIMNLSDLHSGRRTRSFNSEVLAERMAIVGQELDKLATLICNDYNIDALNIFALGDWLLGERLGYQVNVEEVEQFIMSQIFDSIVPFMSQWILDRLSVVPKIRFYGVRGNHGDLGRFQSQSANWDTFAYKVIEQRLSNQKCIEFNISLNDFYAFANVQDATFLLVHGDQFPVSQGQPERGAVQKVLRWNSTMPTPFDYISFGHFHSRKFFMAGSIACYGNGTLLTDDDWARETLGLDGSCSQTALVVSGRDVILEKEIQLAT